VPAQGGDGDQLLERLPAARQLEPAVGPQERRPCAPVPQPCRLARMLDRGWVTEPRVSHRGPEERLGVEGAVERGQGDELERPQERSEPLGLPECLDHRRVAGSRGKLLEPAPDRDAENANALDDLSSAANLAAGHPGGG